jgi:ParB family chromosome partitioning protein
MGMVRPNPHQPRKIFPRAELEELAASIQARGLLQAIKVRPSGDGYEIVCGERRWRAHQVFGAETIRAEVVEMTDDDMADAAIVENLQRKDITPLEEARAFQRRLDAGLTPEELAQRLGLKQVWRVTERTALLKLTPEYQDALARGILTPSQAFEMAKLPPLRQRLVFDAIGAGKCRSYAELRRTVQAHLDAEAQVDLFAVPKDDGESRDRALDALARIEGLAERIGRGLTRAEIAALAQTTDGRNGVLAQKLEMMEKALKALRLELLAAGATRAA